jgi:hypothetical protein
LEGFEVWKGKANVKNHITPSYYDKELFPWTLLYNKKEKEFKVVSIKL